MVNFTECVEELNNYKGSEKKKTLIYNNKKYLVKFSDPIREKNRDISYIKSKKNEECNKAVGRMLRKINIDKIIEFINEIQCMSNVRKDFYIKIIKLRYDILKEIYNEGGI